VDLLLGLLTPQEGRILVDGTPLTPALIGAWRRQVGYVPQETLLFHATIRENLLWVRPDATDEEMSEALRLAAADGFVANLPRGLETVVGDRGVLLSGGERQRLSLARALLRRPRLLVLDEATSSLDSENEMRIQKAIDGLHTQVTMVIVAHRLSTIRSADFIYVLDHGRAVERGTWKELTSRRTGRFLDLYRAQGWQP
jgi:ATP-binding cassette subfamily C protein